MANQPAPGVRARTVKVHDDLWAAGHAKAAESTDKPYLDRFTHVEVNINATTISEALRQFLEAWTGTTPTPPGDAEHKHKWNDDGTCAAPLCDTTDSSPDPTDR